MRDDDARAIGALRGQLGHIGQVDVPAEQEINLVWEIERHLVESKKSQTEMQTLYQARELLGMGNTQVSTDTPTGFEDSQ